MNDLMGAAKPYFAQGIPVVAGACGQEDEIFQQTQGRKPSK
jgi:hypothetical protein